MGQAHGLAASRGAMEASSLGIGWQDHQGRLYQLQSPQHLIRTAGSIVVPADLEQRLLDSGWWMKPLPLAFLILRWKRR